MIKLIFILLLFCGGVNAQIGMTAVFSPFHFGAAGDGVADDTDEMQAAINAARKVNGKVLINGTVSGFRVTRTLIVNPDHGTEVYIDMEGQGIPRQQIIYEGAAGTVCFDLYGLRMSEWKGIKVAMKSGKAAFNVDTKGTASSTSFNTFINCHVALYQAGQRGFRIGNQSLNGGDISDLMFINCSVFGTYQPGSNQIGWLIEGNNTLHNQWSGGFGSGLSVMISNMSDPGTSSTGNGACYIYGLGASSNELDFNIGNTQNWLISGGRYESGKRFMNVTWNNKSPAIKIEGVKIDDYGPSDGTLFYIDMPCSLELNASINSGSWPAYNQNMIKLGGGQYGSQVGIGKLMVTGGGIEASDPFYSFVNDTEWRIYVKGVGRLSDDEVNIGFMNDVEIK